MKLTRLFTLEYIEDGYEAPPWYLPLYMEFERRCVVYCPCWLWPAMMLFYLTRAALWSVVTDCYRLNVVLQTHVKNKLRNKGVAPWWR